MSAEWWQNFANNFATDLAPLISLFGESPTKQYLSETLTFVDVFIFSMAPIGVLTALVSAIRVAGGPSLRAFIGRAQEGAGIAEAELCSSTSRNVCELYNNGGIARVFGRPKILELVHDWEGKSEPQPNEESWKPRNETEIYSFREYVNRGNWQETKAKAGLIRNEDEENRPGEDPVKPIQYSANDFAPHPNLSLNVGIKKLPRISFYLAAVLGFVLQAGVLVYAGLITYKYPNRFQRDDSQIAVPAFPFACAGTVLVCIGVGICASIIERTTYEKTFERTKDTSRLYWIQPGDQIVGDQVFDCFAYSDAKNQIKEYTTSKREVDRDNDAKRFLAKQSFLVWVASLATTIGFSLQFLGLRALHSTVSVAQFGAILIMSTIRALLRTRRLEEEHNILGSLSALYLRHELDWLAIEMAQESRTYSAQGVSNLALHRPSWRVTGPKKIAFRFVSLQKSTPKRSKDKATKAHAKRVKLAEMTGAQTTRLTSAIDDPWDDSMIASRVWATKLARAIEGIMSIIELQCPVIQPPHKVQISWDIGCLMKTTAKGRPYKSTVSLTIIQDTEGTGLHGPWRADRSELESVLGLWLWSMILAERIGQSKDKEPPGPNNSIIWASRLISALGDSDFSDREASLRLWLENHSSPLQEAQLKPEDTTFFPGGLWVKEDDGNVYKQASEKDFQTERKLTGRRIFGSNIIPTNIFANAEKKPFGVLHLPSTSSLEMMCAQELFAIFFSTIIPQIDEIRGDTEIVKGPRRLHVANSTISKMIECFISAGIGNHDDAIACMVPVLYSAKKLSYSSVFKAAREAIEHIHRRGDLVKGEKDLFTALKLALQGFEFESESESESQHVIPLPGDTERTGEIFLCLISLCELYRLSMLRKDKWDHLFGLRGFISLYDLWTKYGKAPKDLVLYGSVTLNLCKKRNDDGSLVQTIKKLRERSKRPDIEITDESFHDALHKGNLGGVLCTLDIDAALDEYSDRYYHQSSERRPVLAIAAKHGWYQVMRTLERFGADTRNVDQNGLNYLHYAAKSCDALIIKDLINEDSDLIQSVDNLKRSPLHLAAAAGRTDVVKLLTQNVSVEVNTRDKFLKSPLDNAILSNHPDTFDLLSVLEQERDAESPPGDGWDVETKRLFQAACCGSAQVVRRLLATIVSSDSIKQLRPARNKLVECEDGFATDQSDGSQKFIRVFELLREHGYLADTWKIEGRTPLSFAAEANKTDLVNYLLENCSQSSIIGMDNSGKTCLHHAVISESESAVEALMGWKHSKDFNVKDKNDLDPLGYALKQKSFSIASVLLKGLPHGQQLILPGTAIAEQTGSIYFQGTDSRIRQIAPESHRKGLGQGMTPSDPVRLYTPLAVVKRGQQVQYSLDFRICASANRNKAPTVLCLQRQHTQ